MLDDRSQSCLSISWILKEIIIKKADMNLSPARKLQTGSGNDFQIPTKASEWVVWCSVWPKVSTPSWEVATEFALALLSQLVRQRSGTVKHDVPSWKRVFRHRPLMRRIPYVLRGKFLRQAHHNLPSASVCIENDRRSREVGLVDISSEELVEAMVSVATKLWASLGNDAKALFDAEVWSGWVAPSWK